MWLTSGFSPGLLKLRSWASERTQVYTAHHKGPLRGPDGEYSPFPHAKAWGLPYVGSPSLLGMTTGRRSQKTRSRGSAYNSLGCNPGIADLGYYPQLRDRNRQQCFLRLPRPDLGHHRHSVKTIGNDAFWGCSGLQSVTYLAEKPRQMSAKVFDNVVYGKATLNYLESADGNDHAVEFVR